MKYIKKMIEKIKSLKLGTILRTVLQILAYANQIVAIIGRTSYAEASWYQWLSVGITVAITVLSYWYNNDWTKLAQMSSSVFDMLKDGKITKDELKEFIDKHKNTKED